MKLLTVALSLEQLKELDKHLPEGVYVHLMDIGDEKLTSVNYWTNQVGPIIGLAMVRAYQKEAGLPAYDGTPQTKT